jgi:hypothetical protein
VSQITYEGVLRLLGASDLPGTKEEKDLLVSYSHDLIQRNGEEWVKENAPRLIREWKELVRSYL